MASVRRLFGWVAGLVGIAAAARYLARRSRAAAPPPARPATGTDPAEALRRKLDETRTEAPAEPPTPDPGAAEETPRETLEERRARVHAKAEAAIAEMQEPPA
jgi:hypothetical protein